MDEHIKRTSAERTRRYRRRRRAGERITHVGTTKDDIVQLVQLGYLDRPRPEPAELARAVEVLVSDRLLA